MSEKSQTYSIIVKYDHKFMHKRANIAYAISTGGKRKFIVFNEVKCGGSRGRNGGSWASRRKQKLDHGDSEILILSSIRRMLILRLRKMMLIYENVEEILSVLKILKRFPSCLVGWISFPFEEVFVFAWIVLNTNLLLKRKISMLTRIFALESTSDDVVNFVFILGILVV